MIAKVSKSQTQLLLALFLLLQLNSLIQNCFQNRCFSETDVFSQTEKFSETTDFIRSKQFSQSDKFSISKGFTYSSYFSDSEDFTKSLSQLILLNQMILVNHPNFKKQNNSANLFPFQIQICFQNHLFSVPRFLLQTQMIFPNLVTLLNRCYLLIQMVFMPHLNFLKVINSKTDVFNESIDFTKSIRFSVNWNF